MKKVSVGRVGSEGAESKTMPKYMIMIPGKINQATEAR